MYHKKKFPQALDRENVTIEGILMRVSDPSTYELQNKRGAVDYYRLGIKTADEKRIMVSLSTDSMGYSGDFNKSKIWYYNDTKKRILKTSLTRPESYLGKKFVVTGYIETISEKDRKYRMSRVSKVVIYID